MTTAYSPLKNETSKFKASNSIEISTFATIAAGLKPNRPIVLITNTLPKTPIIESPINPKEWNLYIHREAFAPKMPSEILRSAISPAFILNGRNPYHQFYRSSIYFEQSNKR